MGFRFRKSVNLGPVRFTASKSGISTSVGVRGFRVTKKANGKVQTTTSIPGTGISYTSSSGGGKQSHTAKRKPFYTRWWFIGLVVLIVLGAIGGRGSSGSETAVSTPAPSAQAELQAPAAERSLPVEAPDPTPAPLRTYILNLETNVFHTQGCQHVQRMKDSNKQEIESTYQDMINQGYSPCETCNPR